VLELFDSLGIKKKIKNGYYYPMSNQASSIRNALVNEAILKGVSIRNDVLVEYINYLDNHFVLNTNIGVINCDKVIIATGSKALPKSGSDGMGYNFLKKFGHDVIKPLPALVQLIGKGKFFKQWSGVRSYGTVSLYENDQFIRKETGEIQLTDYGVSGVCTFQLSGLIARGLYEQKKEQIVIDFLSWLDVSFDEYMSVNEGFTISQILEGSLNYKIVNMVLDMCNITNESKWSDLTIDERKKLADTFTNFKVDIIDTKGFDKCQVCSGGIPLKDIDVNTMESKYQKGLYVVGELLNIDGECGGYNLAFAFLTGMIAGSSVLDD
jgi:predicted Rossmann fold flavoprotein